MFVRNEDRTVALASSYIPHLGERMRQLLERALEEYERAPSPENLQVLAGFLRLAEESLQREAELRLRVLELQLADNPNGYKPGLERATEFLTKGRPAMALHEIAVLESAIKPKAEEPERPVMRGKRPAYEPIVVEYDPAEPSEVAVRTEPQMQQSMSFWQTPSDCESRVVFSTTPPRGREPSETARRRHERRARRQAASHRRDRRGIPGRRG